MEKLSNIIQNKKLDRDYRCSYEFQAYGNRLAEELGDRKHRTLYIKLAKNEDRKLRRGAHICPEFKKSNYERKVIYVETYPIKKRGERKKIG